MTQKHQNRLQKTAVYNELPIITTLKERERQWEVGVSLSESTSVHAFPESETKPFIYLSGDGGMWTLGSDYIRFNN